MIDADSHMILAVSRKSKTALKSELYAAGHLMLDGWTKDELVNEVIRHRQQAEAKRAAL